MHNNVALKKITNCNLLITIKNNCLQGGIKAVMWTDTFQTIVMFGSFLAVIIKGNNDIGGAKKVFDVNYQGGRIELFK